MYIPEIYKNENRGEIDRFIRENGFAILVNLTGGRLWATHIPLELETREGGKTFLHGHISKENPQAGGFTQNDDVLAIFQGPHAYVSSSWYDHENVPTWNYIAVHVYGKVRLLNENQALASLKKLVDKYEAASENPVRMEDLSEKTLRQARGIVGFEIEISEIHAKKKLSQNRDDKNYRAVIANLEKSGGPDAIRIAEEMKKTKK